jgi:predicted hydrocarbon binding protein
MAPDDIKTLTWNPENGTITFAHSGAAERTILIRGEYTQVYMGEIFGTIGMEVAITIFSRAVKKLGAPRDIVENPTFENVGEFFNSYFVPVDTGRSNIPGDIRWDGKASDLILFGDTPWQLTTTTTARSMNEGISDFLTENTARALFRNAARKAGIAVSERAAANYGWTSLDAAVSELDKKVFRTTFPLVGWGNAAAAVQKGADGNWMILSRCYHTYESEGVTAKRPACVGLISYMEGLFEGVFSKLGGKLVSSREVKCRALGDPYCAHAYKLRDKDSGPADWDELAPEWRALDKAF